MNGLKNKASAKRILEIMIIRLITTLALLSGTSIADGPRPLIQRLELRPLENIYGAHLIQYESTHRRNYILDLDNGSMSYIGDGDIEIKQDGTIINRFKKSYFNQGGAFWYDLKRDLKGIPIEVIDRNDATNCYEGEELEQFDDSIITLLEKQKKKTFCVWEK